MNLRVFGTPAASNAPATQSTEFTLAGRILSPGTYDLADLQAFPPTVATNVTFVGGGGPTPPNDYTGVPLFDLLSDAGLTVEVLTGYLVATATDGYRELLSLAELDPSLNPRAANYLVAYDDIGSDFPGAGFARLIFPGDNRGGRYISNVVSLTVIAAVPQPGTLVLYLSGLVVTAILTCRHIRGACAN